MKTKNNSDKPKPYHPRPPPAPFPVPKPQALTLKENLNVQIYSLRKFIYLFLQQHSLNPSSVEISVRHTLGAYAVWAQRCIGQKSDCRLVHFEKI